MSSSRVQHAKTYIKDLVLWLWMPTPNSRCDVPASLTVWEINSFTVGSTAALSRTDEIPSHQHYLRPQTVSELILEWSRVICQLRRWFLFTHSLFLSSWRIFSCSSKLGVASLFWLRIRLPTVSVRIMLCWINYDLLRWHHGSNTIVDLPDESYPTHDLHCKR